MRKMAIAVVLLVALAFQVPGRSQQQQPVPDAPSAARPSQPFPSNTAPAPKVPERAPEPGESSSAGQPADSAAPAAPATPIERAPSPGSDRPDITVGVNLVIVPVTVKDSSGRLVEGLLRRDFSVLEDGAEQPIRFFSSDPWPLSAAIIIDRGLPATEMKKVNESLPSIVGAFSEFDEVSLYSYGSSVERHLDFGAAGDRLAASIRESRKSRAGRAGGVPVTAGPMAAGPTVNGRPFDPGAPRVVTPVRESRVMNDAIMRAAIDLGRRERSRRRVIFVVTDGTESGSTAAMDEVRKVLLSNEITVYGVGVGAAAIPGYSTAQRIHLPGTSVRGNMLPQYVSITGGEILTEFSATAMERAYARLTEMPRNQYTIGYTARSGPASLYRGIEVKVFRPNLQVFARDGYFPAPPAPAPADSPPR